MSSRRSLALTCALTFASALLCGAPASAEKSEAQVTDDIAFAKGLAKEWGFVDLAGDVIKGIEREGVSSKTGERLGVVKCEIFAQGALAERDRLKRNDLFELALAAYEEFLTNNPNSSASGEARSGYINMASAFARSLELSMEEAVGEAAEAMHARRQEVLLAADKRTQGLVEELKSIREPSEAEKRERGNVMMMRARIQLEIGKTMEIGIANFEEAKSVLEDVVFDQGEGSPMALRAYDMIGQVYSAEQDWESASIYFEAVIEQALPSDPKAWAKMVDELELADSDKDQRWLFVELSTSGLVDAKMGNGEVADACKYALHLYNTQRREGFTFSTTLGYPAVLAAARALLNAGGIVGGNLGQGQGQWFETEEAAKAAGFKRSRDRIATTDFALKIAQQVVSENQGNILQVKGQNLIAEVTTRPGVIVAPSVLYEAAEGKYNSGEMEDCLSSFKMVLSALEGKDGSTRIEFGPRTFYYMGRAYQRLGRHFEAAMSFREGCTTWLGDPEFDGTNAQGYYKSMQELTRQAPGDAALKTIYEASEKLAAELSQQDQDQIRFNLGEKYRRQKEYDKAIAEYKQVRKSAMDYEKAVVNIGVCEFRKGQKEAGYAIFVDYLENYVTNDLNSLGGSTAKEAKRKDAMAAAGFYRCLHEYSKQDYAGVVAHASNYHVDFEDQTSMAPWVMRCVGNSLAHLGKVDEAKAFLQTALDLYPDNKHVAAFAIEFYKLLKAQRAVAATVEEKRALLLEMATLLEIGNKAASKPSFDNLRAESKHWFDLAMWDKSIGVLEKLSTKFGSDADREKEMVTYVLPDLAHSYLSLDIPKVPEAHAILSDLAISTVKMPSKRTLLDYTKSVTGWVTGNATEIRHVPGAGEDKAAFQDATDKLNSLANGVDEKWTCEWYSLKFQLAYGYYQWASAEGGPKDSHKLLPAKKQLDALIQELGSQFHGRDGIPGVGQNCDEDPERASAMGKDVLRRRLVWLWGKVKSAK